jgi:hypothetical protein
VRTLSAGEPSIVQRFSSPFAPAKLAPASSRDAPSA